MGAQLNMMVGAIETLAKNVVSIHDAQGKQVFADRSDALGDKTLGAMGAVVVDQSSIAEWVEAYDKGIHTLRHRARLVSSSIKA
jgi:hypothetical protein